MIRAGLFGSPLDEAANLPCEDAARSEHGVNQLLQGCFRSRPQLHILCCHSLKGVNQPGERPIRGFEAINQDSAPADEAALSELDTVAYSAPVTRVGREDLLEGRGFVGTVVPADAGAFHFDGPVR